MPCRYKWAALTDVWTIGWVQLMRELRTVFVCFCCLHASTDQETQRCRICWTLCSSGYLVCFPLSSSVAAMHITLLLASTLLEKAGQWGWPCVFYLIFLLCVCWHVALVHFGANTSKGGNRHGISWLCFTLHVFACVWFVSLWEVERSS